MPRTNEGHIYTVGSGHSDGLTTNAIAASTSKNEIKPVYDVVVVGAGFAGLVAARDLSKEGVTVLLIEARDRIGGRTWTAKAWGEEYEMGGTWIHWTQPHVYAELSRYNLHKTLKTTSGSVAIEAIYNKPRGSKQTSQAIDLAAFSEKQERLVADFFTLDGMTARELMPFPHDPSRNQPWKMYDDLSVRDRLDQLHWEQQDKDMIEIGFASIGCAPGTDIAFTSALEWFALSGYTMNGFGDAVGLYKLGEGGMTGFAGRILDEFEGDRLFETCVRAIQTDDDGASIEFADGSHIQARQVVCTIPLNCLKDIEFKPPLSALRQEAFQKGHINKGTKIHYHLDQVEPGWGAGCVDHNNSDLLFALSDHNGTQDDQPNGTHCVAFGYGGHLEDPSEDKRIVAALQELKPDVSVKGYLTHDWAKDPFAQGTWYCASAGTTTKYSDELQKPHGRIRMASADWADGWRGFVDGAIEQGRRATMQVAEALKAEKSAVNGRH